MTVLHQKYCLTFISDYDISVQQRTGRMSPCQPNVDGDEQTELEKGLEKLIGRIDDTIT